MRLNLTAIVLLSFIHCHMPVGKKMPVHQIFTEGNYTAFVFIFENSDCLLRITQNDRAVFEETIARTPCIVSGIRRDTIIVEKLRLSTGTGGDSIYRSINNKLVLKIRDRYSAGSANAGHRQLDSMRIHDRTLLCFDKRRVDSIPANNLFFDGKLFYTHSFECWNHLDIETRVATFYDIEDPDFRKDYWQEIRGVW